MRPRGRTHTGTLMGPQSSAAAEAFHRQPPIHTVSIHNLVPRVCGGLCVKAQSSGVWGLAQGRALCLVLAMPLCPCLPDWQLLVVLVSDMGVLY